MATAVDPVGPENEIHLGRIIRGADVLVPRWGSRTKLPKSLHVHLGRLLEQLVASGEPVLAFGVTGSGDPKYPLMLGYSTKH
ncbi:DUF1643 domain-containing protein, partial [Salmonella enterica]|uniref:DUF1643 domain-containing protein n=1 Tax=Salmonella enterica TaxID=28901 RepID=UPI003221548A